jgi:hypothetical protein
MEQADLLGLLVTTLERLGIRYLLTGSLASSAFGEPRYTHDIDVVAALDLVRAEAICAAFPAPEFYCSPDAAREAVCRTSQFNILHPASGLKIDVIVASNSEFDQSRLARGVRLPAAPNVEATFASPEDVIIKKLQYFREGGSEKHLRDIAGVLKVQADRIDRTYLDGWIDRLGLSSEWDQVQARL